jgi:hypothetical protein
MSDTPIMRPLGVVVVSGGTSVTNRDLCFTPEVPKTSIIAGPYKANTSGGRWAVRLRNDYPSGAQTEYGEHFWRKVEALAWIADCGHPDERGNQ